jgi:hypothetical protein
MQAMEAPDYVRSLMAMGVTQVAIAQKTEIPQPTISRIARGVVKDVPSRRSRRLQALWELEKAQREQREAVGENRDGRMNPRHHSSRPKLRTAAGAPNAFLSRCTITISPLCHRMANTEMQTTSTWRPLTSTFRTARMWVLSWTSPRANFLTGVFMATSFLFFAQTDMATDGNLK